MGNVSCARPQLSEQFVETYLVWQAILRTKQQFRERSNTRPRSLLLSRVILVTDIRRFRD